MKTGKNSIKSLSVAILGLGLSLFGCSNNPVSSEPEVSGQQIEDQALSAVAVTTTLTLTTDGHGVTYPSATASVTPGKPFCISAAPKMGYEFYAWSVVSGSATFENQRAAVTRVTLGTTKTTIKANYIAVNPTVYNLTVTNDGHGTTMPKGVSKVNIGQTIYLTATASKGYVFNCWTVTAGKAAIANASAALTTMKLVTGNATVKATFKVKTAK